MRVCSGVTVEKWQPNFSSSGQVSPTWTRVHCLGMELCNSLEWTEWAENPVQVILCDACGYAGCGSGGYAHVSRLGPFILWTTPQIDASDDWAATQYLPLPALDRLGAVAIPEGTWDQWRRIASQLPEASAFSQTNGAALADAWSLGPGRPRNIQELLPMLRARLLGCDTLDPGEAIDRVQRWIERLSANAATVIAGVVRTPDEVGAQVETLYFDGPSDEDWPALAIRGAADFLLLDREHAFVPISPDG